MRWLVLVALAGCTIDELDYTGKGCPCPEGWLCQQPQNRCARADQPPSKAADWSGSMRAVYLFEQPTPLLGADSSPHGLDLIETPVVASSTVEPRQGSLALDIADGSLFSTAPGFTGIDGVSFGGWIAPVSAPADDALLLGRERADGSGYSLRWSMQSGLATCSLGDGTNTSRASGALPEGWAHVVCRWDRATGLMELVIDAQVTTAEDPVMTAGNPDEAFRLSSDENGFSGRMDEIFVHDKAITDEAIRRIVTCGIDGARCVCDPADATRYAACGPVDCAALAPCNAAAP